MDKIKAGRYDAQLGPLNGLAKALRLRVEDRAR